jgi:site-specific DNA-methyltransferase (adenine-specific)
MWGYRKRHRRLSGSLEVMGSSRSDEWPTDPAVFARLNAEYGPFDLDPCATAENTKCERFFTKTDDGLSQTWTGRVYMNPPYGRTIGDWMRKAWEASQTTAELVVCLIPARVDTAWWHDYACRGEVTFPRGRLRFGDCENSAPFPSAIVVFRNAKTVTKLADETEAA